MITLSTPPDTKTTGEATRKPGRGRRIWSIVMASIVAHIAVFVVFGLVVVARFFTEPEATFTVAKNVVIPAQTREHQMEMAEHEAAAPRPTFTEKLISTAPTDFAFPEAPDVTTDELSPFDPNQIISDQLSSLAGTAGMGFGTGLSAAGGGGEGEGMSFFDIRDVAKSVVIMIDVSASMFGRTGDLDYSTRKLVRRGKEQSFQGVREEAFKLIDGLSVNTRFNIIHWSGSARIWREGGLVPASGKNKTAAKEHIQSRIDYGKAGPTEGRRGGTRHDYALEAVLALEPETVFMLTDGNATESLEGGGFRVIEGRELYALIREAREARETVPRIHTIYYLTGRDKQEEERMLKGLATRTGGKFRKVKAPQKQ